MLWRLSPWPEISAATSVASERPLLITGVTVAYASAFWLRAVAWQTLLARPASAATLFRNLQFSLLLNHLLPIKAGEVSRPVLAVRRGIPWGDAAASTAVARLLDLLCLAFIATVLLSTHRAVSGGAFVVLTAACAGGLLIFRRGFLGHRAAVSLPWPRLSGRVEAVREALAGIPFRRLAIAAPLVAASWLLEGAVLFGAAEVMGVELGVRTAVAATAFTILCQIVHFTPGGLGVYEAAMTSALVGQGIGAEQALALAILTHGMKFAYAFTVGAAFALEEAVFLLGGRAGEPPRRASRIEVVAARSWNVLNEGKPFTPVFALGIIALLFVPDSTSIEAWTHAAVALVMITPLALVFWCFDFPLRLRAALWIALGTWMVLAPGALLVPAGLVVTAYLGFTVVLWGTVYYHLRIGTRWTNGIRFVRLVAENADPTSGNLLEQIPKVLVLVLAFMSIYDSPGAGTLALVGGYTLAVGLVAVLLHQWFFTWVPPVPQPRLVVGGGEDSASRRASAPRRARRVIAIVIDGCRADRLLEAQTPFLDRLRAEGTDVRLMTTVYPARTVTCFSSMLTGAASDVHGMRSNFVPSLGVKCESIFDVLRQAGMCGRLVGIAHLIDAFGDRDVRSVTAVMDNDEIDAALVAEAQRVLRDDDPELLVLQLLSVDQTGHARGSYNAEYLAKIEETDRTIESFLGWCRDAGYLDDAMVLVTADHGQGIGIGGHGHMSLTEAHIPCILWGAGVEPAQVIEERRFITDIAPTIAHALGCPAPKDSAGRALSTPEHRGDGPVVFVIPARNEEHNLPGVLRAVREAGIPNAQAVVVDDGSTDQTAAVARAHGAVVVSHPQGLGLGAAVRTGLAVARGMDARAAVYLDADGEYDAREAKRLLAPIEVGAADYVLGSRFAGRPEGMTVPRRVANRFFSVVVSILTRRWISDGQTGYRAFSWRALEVAEIVHDYNYAQVLTLDLVRKGMRTEEVPVTYRRRSQGQSFISLEYLWRVPLGMLREVVRA